jgi:ABC-type transporter MlaC component
MEKNGKGYDLLTIVSKRGEETEVLLTFMPFKKGWRIIDVAIDGESWVQNIQEQVFKTIKKDKWAGLKKSMNKRLSKLYKNKGRK